MIGENAEVVYCLRMVFKKLTEFFFDYNSVS